MKKVTIDSDDYDDRFKLELSCEVIKQVLPFLELVEHKLEKETEYI